MTAPVLHWFRRDLRVADNPALDAAAASGGPVIPIFILDDRTPNEWAIGGAGRWWLHHSLAALSGRLDGLGSRLILRRGPAKDVLREVAAETGAAAVHAARDYGMAPDALDRAVKAELERCGVAFRGFRGALLIEPDAVTTKGGGPYKVYTPFYKAVLERLSKDPPLPAPVRLTAPAAWPESDRLDDWALSPRTPDWAGGLRGAWTPGETGAQDRLDAFIDGPMADYAASRDRPGISGTSRLSPHLHFGEIGPRQIWSRVAHAIASGATGDDAGATAFLRQLVWREFSHHLLHHFPHLPEAPFRGEFAAFPWRDDPAALVAWQHGRTGYPIVDAGMRELWHTGWMHNRVRMVAASFLTKHLLIPWQAGAAWFWDTLVDADLANNSAGWQWVAGSGADAAPYFRIFNPVAQGEKFDPDGAYVGRWVPEIAALPDKYLHRPWTAPQNVLNDAGLVLGETYPMPLVDHAAARQRALRAFEEFKSSRSD